MSDQLTVEGRELTPEETRTLAMWQAGILSDYWLRREMPWFFEQQSAAQSKESK